MPVQVDELNIDMLSASAHKFHGPKGVGFFYMRNSVKLGAYLHGGAQERSRRAGTSNVPGIVGMAKAAQLAVDGMEENSKKIAAVRDHLIGRVLSEVPFSRLNGHPEQRLPNNANFCFRFIEGESLLIMLDQKGSALPAVLPAHPVLWIRLMCCWRSDCRMRSRMAPCV